MKVMVKLKIIIHDYGLMGKSPPLNFEVILDLLVNGVAAYQAQFSRRGKSELC